MKVTEPSKDLIRITFTIGKSGRFIDMNTNEATEVAKCLTDILSRKNTD